jgi:hypothetical protein
MPYEPKTADELIIEGIAYRFAEDPLHPGKAYRKEGTEGTIFQLIPVQRENAAKKAVKVFHAEHARPTTVARLEDLRALSELPGLSVCRRTVLTPQKHAEVLSKHRELLYAVVMPWIEGPSFREVMMDVRELSRKECLTAATSLAYLLTEMEQRGVAHGDLSAANLMLPMLAEPAAQTDQSAIQLVDVEQLYGLPREGHQPPAVDTRGPYADRFTGAVLLAEILGWVDPYIREASAGESYFEPGELRQDSQRYRMLLASLNRNWGKEIARLVSRAWENEELKKCPAFGEWLVDLGRASAETPDQTIAPVIDGTTFLMVEPAALHLRPSQTAQLRAYMVRMDGRKEEVTERVRWSTDHSDVGTVNQQGEVTAVSDGGSMVVMAEYEEQRTVIHITVSEAEPQKKRAASGKRLGMLVGGAVVAATLVMNGVVLSQVDPSKSEQEVEHPLEQKVEQPAASAEPPEAASSELEPVPAPSQPSTSAAQPSPPVAQSLPPVAQPAPSGPPPTTAVAETAKPPATAQAVRPAATMPKPAGKPDVKQTVRQAPEKKRNDTPRSAKPQTAPAVKQTVAAGTTHKSPSISPPASVVVLQPVERNGKWGYIKRVNLFDQELVIPYQFDHATGFSDGLALVKKDGKFGYINAQGTVVIGIQYDFATPFRNGSATVKKDGKLRKIDKSGSFIDS